MFQHERGATYLILLYLVAFLFPKKVFYRNAFPSRSVFAGVLAFSTYLAGLFVVYLCTPYDLTFHVHNSIDRTLLSFDLMVLGSIAFVIQDSDPAKTL
jgi:hypothetical protein